MAWRTHQLHWEGEGKIKLTFAFWGLSCFGFFARGRGLGRGRRFRVLLGCHRGNSVDFLRGIFGLFGDCGGFGSLFQHSLIFDVNVVLIEEECVTVINANAVSALHLEEHNVSG